jgi:hypothetical protein
MQAGQPDCRLFDPPALTPKPRPPPFSLGCADVDDLTEESKLLLYSLHQQATVVSTGVLGHARFAGTAISSLTLLKAHLLYPPAVLTGSLQRAQALGLVCGEQRKVAVLEAAG